MSATRIWDADAFAACLARGVEHPVVRECLDRPRRLGSKVPGPVEVPIAELLGPDGHQYCDGHRLDPVGGSLEAAVANRLARAKAERGPEPTSTRLTGEDFAGAGMVFTFAPNQRGAWKLWTMYPDPDDSVMPRRYWQDGPGAPFAVLLDVVETYCHPEAYDWAYDDLNQVLHLPERDPVFDRFAGELRSAIRQPGLIPDGALLRAAVYDDASAGRFLARLWCDLYPGEPLPR